ncbi:HDOD domain-containing protein [Blastopirellula sp. JC732]|uniref:HDOD domain-containing protein n=1 Tax=Blastopirellula sediminis TaxID=2894196 RepID=A0A9X1MSW7_9BACT|nr:HDOD domain-containing protein [Blastopirellula sediminis]MCC9604895.1 HDOD domain-containing protein [Blastopirellula sediminis]MCC9631805.1 HDOD domain-containing protein [Blastopirellula sediminis]
MTVATLKVLNEEALDILIQRVEEVSSLPQIAIQAMGIASTEESSASDLTAVIECDVALSARVLKLVNSSAFGLRNKVTNLQQAIAYLGMKQVRNLAITASVSELFQGGDKIGRYSRSGLWEHMVAVGIAARMFAKRHRIGDPEDAFIAGLLHDLGIVILDQFLNTRFEMMLSAMTAQQVQVRWEQQYFGFDHTEFGERVARHWKFPEPVIDTIRYHHMAGVYRGPNSQLIKAVEMGNMAMTEVGITSLGAKYNRLSMAALNNFDMTIGDLSRFGEEVKVELTKYHDWLVY